MTITEKLCYLQDNHLGEWLKTRQEVENDLSSRQSILCLCGRLATGFHEKGCRKFIGKVNSETVKKLNHLIVKNNE